MDQGLWRDDHEPSALLFVREIPRQRAAGGPRRLAEFVDLNADGLLDADAQRRLASLKSRLFASYKEKVNLHCVELSRGGVDRGRREHAQYLDAVCEQFVSQMKDRIEAVVSSSAKRRKIWGRIEDGTEDSWDRLVEEVGRHAAVSAELCGDLCGREGLLGRLCLAMWESTNAHHDPLVVHGAAGIGKTALLCKLAQEMRRVLEDGAVVVIRLLSARPRRPDVDHVLRSVCFQICRACGLTPPPPLTANSHPDLVRFFRGVLTAVSEQGSTLFVILDALDQLSDRHAAHKLRWLPASVPPNVHLVVSMDTGSEAFAAMRLKLASLRSFYEVERLSGDEGGRIMASYLRAARRTLTSEQRDGVLRRFETTGCPLHLKLLLSAARRWTSSTRISDLHLGADTPAVMSHLLLVLEEKHGKELVGGALGYITLAR